MTLAKEKPEEETHFDRRKKYRELVAGGMTDRNATETVWPSTKLGMEKKAKDKAEKEKKEE